MHEEPCTFKSFAPTHQIAAAFTGQQLGPAWAASNDSADNAGQFGESIEFMRIERDHASAPSRGHTVYFWWPKKRKTPFPGPFGVAEVSSLIHGYIIPRCLHRAPRRPGCGVAAYQTSRAAKSIQRMPISNCRVAGESRAMTSPGPLLRQKQASCHQLETIKPKFRSLPYTSADLRKYS